MNKLMFTIATALFAMGAAAQETTTMDVGYCSDESTGAIGLTEKGLNAAAVRFDGDFLTQYAGNRVKSIVLQLGASFGSAGSVFVTDALGDNIPERYTSEYEIPDFDYVPCYRWIEVPLPDELIITPGEPFYAGLRILPYKSAPYYGAYQFAVDDNEAGAEHCYIYDDIKKKWGHLPDYTFEDYPAPNFLIKLRLEGSALPVNDLSVGDLVCKDYQRTTDSSSCAFSITNLASNEVSNFDVELVLDGTLCSTCHIDLDKALKTGDATTCSVDGIKFANEGTHTVAVRVTNPNGVADTHPENNVVEHELNVIDTYFNHNVLVEAFTTMQCANCPGAHDRQDQAFDGREGVVRVDHHSGFGTDVLTTNADRDFLWFYNNRGTTYAPGMMFDRVMVDDFFDPQRSPGEEHTPVIGPGDAENMVYIFEHLAERPAYVDVNISGTYDKSTRQLQLTISGESIAKLKGTNTVVNVWLTESGLSAADNRKYGQMTGSGNYDFTFVHNHTMRSTLTGSWGKSLPLDIAPYSVDFSTTLAADWKAENMDVVAFISNYDSTNPENCVVYNSASRPVASLGTDIDGVVSPSALQHGEPVAFDLSGRSVKAMRRGVVIVDGKKIIR